MIWPRVSGPDHAAILDVTKGGGVGGLSATTGFSSGVKFGCCSPLVLGVVLLLYGALVRLPPRNTRLVL